jgi:hypothetical protein
MHSYWPCSSADTGNNQEVSLELLSKNQQSMGRFKRSGKSFNLDVSNLPPDVYYIIITKGNESQTVRIVKE